MKKLGFTLIFFLFSCSQEINSPIINQEQQSIQSSSDSKEKNNFLISYKGFVRKDKNNVLFLGVNRKLLGIPLDSKTDDDFHSIYQVNSRFKNDKGYLTSQVYFGQARFGKDSKLYYQSYNNEFVEIGNFTASSLPLKENDSIKITLRKEFKFTSNRVLLNFGGGPVPEGVYLKGDSDISGLIKNITEKNLY